MNLSAFTPTLRSLLLYQATTRAAWVATTLVYESASASVVLQPGTCGCPSAWYASNWPIAAPSGASYWCNDPIQRRRGLRLGHVVAPIYYDTQPGSPGTDVDSVPLPAFGSSLQHAAGTVMYNDASLSNCPPNPTVLMSTTGDSLDELLEAAAELGVDVN